MTSFATSEMRVKNQSIQVKLRNGFLALVSIFVLFTVLAVYLVNVANNQFRNAHELNVLEQNISQLREIELLLYAPSLIPDAVYTNPEEYIQTEISPLNQNIEECFVKLTNTYQNDIQENQLDSIHQFYTNYYSELEALITLISKRGHKDFGQEGVTRKLAHLIEDSLYKVKPSQILMLRRHEKDFLLRGEKIYLSKFNSLINEILETTELNSNETRILKEYRSEFQRLATLDLEIGTAYMPGLRNQLYELSSTFISIYQSYLRLAQSRVDAEIFNFYVVFITSLLVALLLSIIGSIQLSKTLGKPVKELTGAIQKIQIEDIQNNKRISLDSTITEVYHLENSFNNLLDLLGKQLVLNEKKSNELRDQNEKLNHSEKQLRLSNAVKDKFFSIISHDMRGPISGLGVYLESLQDDLDTMDKEELRSFTMIMLKSVNHVIELMENLLEWSKAQMGLSRPNPTRVSLAESVSHGYNLMTQRFQEKQIMFVSNVSSSHRVYADKNMIEFVIRNLISNALKFTNPGGEIKVKTHLDSNQVVVSISDNGIGISDIDQKKLFNESEHFTKFGTNEEKGTGLGLLLSKEFIHKNKGDIWLTSQENVGTTVFFTLPLA